MLCTNSRLFFKMFDLKDIETALDKNLLSSRQLLSRFSLIDERARNSSVYLAPDYFPFYFHLGRRVQPKSVFESEFGLGLHSGLFFMSCSTVQEFFAFHPKRDVYYSTRLGVKNIKSVYKNTLKTHYGKITDDEFIDKLNSINRDLALLHNKGGYDEQRNFFDVIWASLADDGLMVVDHVNAENRQSFLDFCKINNREPLLLATKYGVGIVKK